jgi:hypothetical protein
MPRSGLGVATGELFSGIRNGGCVIGLDGLENVLPVKGQFLMKWQSEMD